MSVPPEKPETIDLDQFLKLKGVVGTGGEAKMRIQAGEAKVNGVIETRRRRKLVPGDIVELGDEVHTVPSPDSK